VWNTTAPAEPPVYTYVRGELHPVLHPDVELIFEKLLHAELKAVTPETDVIAPYGSPEVELMLMLNYPTTNTRTSIHDPRLTQTM
jgi:hypothetical protein